MSEENGVKSAEWIFACMDKTLKSLGFFFLAFD